MAYDFGNHFQAFGIRLGSTTVTHCVLSEVDAHVYGSAPYYGSVRGNHDPTHLIREAGWTDFEYITHVLDEPGREQNSLQLADHFGVVLYLANIPRNKQHDRKELYDSILETMDVKDEGVFGLMEEADWDLKRLYAKLKGAYQFPTAGSGCASSALSFSAQGSIMQFPWKLYNIPFYKRKYDTCKRSYLAAHPAGDTSLSLVAFPDAASPHNRTWQCPQPGCGRTATQPKAFTDHLAQHAAYHEVTVNLGTIRYSISQGEVTFQHRSRKIQQKVTQQNLGGVNLQHKQKGKRSKSEQLDDKLDKVITALAKVQQDSATEREDSRKRQEEDRKRHEDDRKWQNRMLEVMANSVKNQDEQLKLLASNSSISDQRPSPNISLAQAQELGQMLKNWSANAVDK